ncbi:peptidase M28 [Pirellula staleyi DSM 6068]|uniref:Peptidase M28 n=1 Tax=Pirellula staleyi (strain ATCC 27377 / DSM 6068 / ICPB 4128) TaxID=530564 RepID=D2R032_PIRSD|nr:M28 family peptidase [Pirellula staleyi]ADB18397.1 peptidase M28 [Pirellula staleyi DSM 6068]
MASPSGTKTNIGFYSILILTIGCGLALLSFSGSGFVFSQRAPLSKLTLSDIPFNGERAYEHLKTVCAIGPRISGTQGMLDQQAYLVKHFESIGGKVTLQSFDIRHPETGERTTLANLIVEWHPEREERILVACHYDTRPFPDQDPNPRLRREPFIGANDGGSGVGLLCELGTMMPQFESKYGIDFVLFDGEELVYDDRDKYFLGSEHFSNEYIRNPPRHKYRSGILLDMVGDAELQVFRESLSMSWPETRPIVLDIWKTAEDLGVKEFISRTRHEIRDDHLALRNIAKIPTCDIIDFDYPRPGNVNYWHTTKDVPENCSALSLAKVGWVVHEYLKRLK